MKNNNKTTAEKAVNEVVGQKKSKKKLVRENVSEIKDNKNVVIQNSAPKETPKVAIASPVKEIESFSDKVKRVLRNIFGA